MYLEKKGCILAQSVFRQMWVTHQLAEWGMGLVKHQWNKLSFCINTGIDWWLLCALQHNIHKLKISPEREDTLNNQQTEHSLLVTLLGASKILWDWCPVPDRTQNICYVAFIKTRFYQSGFSVLSINVPVRPFLLPHICLFITCFKVSFKLCDSGMGFLWLFGNVPRMQQVICYSNRNQWIYNT